jgi:transposase
MPMHDETRRRLTYEVQKRKDRGESERSISRSMGIHRKTVRGLLEENAARREAGEPSLEREIGPAPVPRSSLLDPFLERIEHWVDKYKNLTAVRLLEKLKDEGFTGSYTIVREHLKQLRERRKPQKALDVIETPPGQEGQFDWSPYVLPGCEQKIQLWGYSLGHSRGRAFEAWERSTQSNILACLKRSFESHDGVPEICVTDSMPGVVDRWECDRPILNVRFVDFAAHYGFAVDIAPRGCPQYKGKKERTFRYVNENLLNGREFSSIEEFRETLAWWIANKAHQQDHPRTQRPIAQMLEEERPFLKPLPARPYDTREVLIRLVDRCGLVEFQTNFYPVPDKYIGELVYVCVDHESLEVLDRSVHHLAQHLRLPDGAGKKPTVLRRNRYDIDLLLGRLGQWGEIAEAFGERLRLKQHYPGPELSYIIGLQTRWSADDIVRALSHAMRYDAYEARSIERILAARFKPRTLESQIADSARERVRELMRHNPVQQRPLADYKALRTGDNLTTTESLSASPQDSSDQTQSQADNSSSAPIPDPNLGIESGPAPTDGRSPETSS